jgi:hypothetical protein
VSEERQWYHTLGALLFATLSLELGIFLVVFPWSELWHRNWIASLAPQWRVIWDSPYFRGAMSGLGLVDIYIALLEVVRIFRFSVK